MRFSRFRPTPSMAVAVVALVLSASGITWAATSLPRNSVGSAQVQDNSIRSGDIRNGNVRNADIGRNAVHGEQVADNSIGGEDIVADDLTGSDILESSLGKVPAAGLADDSTRLGGRPASGFVSTERLVSFRRAMSFGESSELVRNGPVSLEAVCRENVNGTFQDELRMVAATTQENSFMFGDNPHAGPGAQNADPYLTPNTPENNRVMGGILSINGNPDHPAAVSDIDTGFVAGPNGEYIGVDETTMFALRVGGSDCLIVGTAMVG